MPDPEERAAELLQYYLRNARTMTYWTADHNVDVATIIELIVTAATREAAEELAEFRKEYENKIGKLQRRLDALETQADYGPSMADTVQRAADARRFA